MNPANALSVAALIWFASIATPSINATKLIIDGDPGVDDAVAIVLALSGEVMPAEDVLALTLVEGNGALHQEALNALRILTIMNKTDLPVFLGSSKPLIYVGEKVKDGFFGKDAFGDVSTLEPRPDLKTLKRVLKAEHAANAIVRIAKENKGNITLVCLGPLTNLALALRLEPNLVDYLSEVVVLGGNSRGQGNISPAAEFNFFHDPEAAQIVVNSGLSPVVVPWETLIDHTIPYEEYDEMMSSDTKISNFLRSIGELANNFVRNTGGSYLFGDQVALAVAIDPELITKIQTLPAQVELAGSETRGQLVVDWRPQYTEEQSQGNATVQIVTKYDVQGLRALVTKAVSKKVF